MPFQCPLKRNRGDFSSLPLPAQLPGAACRVEIDVTPQVGRIGANFERFVLEGIDLRVEPIRQRSPSQYSLIQWSSGRGRRGFEVLGEADTHARRDALVAQE